MPLRRAGGPAIHALGVSTRGDRGLEPREGGAPGEAAADRLHDHQVAALDPRIVVGAVNLATSIRLYGHLAAEIPAVVLGDFNVIPEDRDVWSVPAMADDALMQPASRAAYARLLGDGWTDAIATLNPRGGVWTYWDYQAGAWQRDHGFRIDHLLLSPQAADRLLGAGVDKEYRGRDKASDHAPTWVRLR